MAKCQNGTCWKTYTVNLSGNQRLILRSIIIRKKKAWVASKNTAAKVMYQPTNSNSVQVLYSDMGGSWSITGESTFKINREFNKAGTYYLQGFVMTGYTDSEQFENDYEVVVDYEIMSDYSGKPVEGGSKIPIIGDLQEIWRTLNTVVKIAIFMLLIALALYLEIPQKIMKALRR